MRNDLLTYLLTPVIPSQEIEFKLTDSFPGEKYLLVDGDKTITVWANGTLGIFLVGGGGYGDQGNKAGSSGFFKYEMVQTGGKEKVNVKMTIGQG